MSAVSNSGPIIHLSWIGRLDLLPTLFNDVVVPVAVRDEVLQAGPHVPGIATIHDAFAAGWLSVQPVTDSPALATLQLGLDPREAEAIVLMQEIHGEVLLLDERRARARALREGLPITGTLGILRSARNRGLLPAMTPLLERASGNWLSKLRCEQIASGQRPGRRRACAHQRPLVVS